MTELFKGDAYAIITGAANIDLSLKNPTTERRLAIDFNIKQDVDSSPNTAEVTIYNLAEETRRALETKDLVLEVYAGYDDIKLIGTGDIKNVIHTRNGADWETKITTGDGKASLDKSIASKSFVEGTPKKDILDYVSDTFELDIRDVVTSVSGEIVGGMSLTGKSKDVMNDVSREFVFDWSIQDNELLLTDRNKEDDLEAVLINSQTGLLSSPKFTERGVDVSIQLNPDIRPKRVIIVDSIEKSYSGIYIVEECNFVGNNYGGQFDVSLSARSL